MGHGSKKMPGAPTFPLGDNVEQCPVNETLEPLCRNVECKTGQHPSGAPIPCLLVANRPPQNAVWCTLGSHRPVLCLVILGGGGVNWPPWDCGSPTHPPTHPPIFPRRGGGASQSSVYRQRPRAQSVSQCASAHEKRWRSTKLSNPPTHQKELTPPSPGGVPALFPKSGETQTNPPSLSQTPPPWVE